MAILMEIRQFCCSVADLKNQMSVLKFNLQAENIFFLQIAVENSGNMIKGVFKLQVHAVLPSFFEHNLR